MQKDDAEGGRLVKRQKLVNGAAKGRSVPGASRVFAPYRTVGLVSPTAVPFTSVPLGKTTFQLTTSVGRSLQTYDLRKGLNLVFITRPQTPETITASAARKDKVFAAWGGDTVKSQRGVWVFKRGRREAELESPPSWTENVQSFCVLGSWMVGVCQSQMLVWNSETYALYTILKGISPVPFTACIANVPTLLNKVLVGRQDGSAELWNVSSGKLIYTILPPSTSFGAVTAIEPTPALSLVALAYENGQLRIHDVRTDQTVIQLSTPAALAVTSISFRTDGMGAGDDGRIPGVMATSSVHSGDVTLWDLNEGGKKAGVLRAAHAQPTTSSPGGVSRVEFLSGQAVLVSSGLDNSLKTWIFDETPFSPVPRILHSRSGHGAPITKLHFLPFASDGSDDTGKWLISGSKDRSLWGWSLRRDGQSTELSQGAVQSKAKKQGLLSGSNRDSLEALKCPPVVAVACSLNRDGGIGAVPGKHPIWQGAKGKQVSAEVSGTTGWESVITAHENDKKARTWFWGRKRAGRWAFQTGDGDNVTAVAMSPCGTFGLIGSEKGAIDVFNMQSGIHRQRFPARLTPLQAKQLKLDVEKHGLVEEDDGKKKFLRGQGRHASAVVGLAIDNLNKTVMSAGADGKVKFWDFRSGLLIHEINWTVSTGITSMRFHRSSNLAALACSDGAVRVVDVTTFRLIRELFPSRPAIPELNGLTINDMAFSFDGHWIAASIGSLVLLWDLPAGHLIDAFKTRTECTSLAFSPTGEFLATATAGSVGVDVWSNRSLFMHVPARRLGEKELSQIVAGDTQAPTSSGEGGESLVAAQAEIEDDDADLVNGLPEIELDELSSNLLSLSLVPRSRWQNLLHMDLIRQRNKPVEPPKKPEKAPFFLPSAQDRQSDSNALLLQEADAMTMEQERSRISRLHAQGIKSTFGELLRNIHDEQDYARFLAHLQSLSPAAADIEIRTMTVEGRDMVTFVQSLTWLLQQKRDFELGQAWMAVFLRVHGDIVLGSEALRDAVAEWSRALQAERRRVQRLADYCSGLVGYMRAARV
ncbi:Utp21 specific WD40 associated putative domain-containing protein [Neohortaea acidophila]|uniref:Utp21 specific WD40 associated putative domain-containing protein n=1 Tax=Neohortaea acidophila TaxID=245834 RepID=A0A6A6Q7M1_9PEZI|nr:Utp21 specific WD40 associated putative domain-containing protein [Neohortaea acidophila]KAF2487946.1 Utp21 specific WD40 associated putative domain-containing protein [Neohortaea acidophila]